NITVIVVINTAVNEGASSTTLLYPSPAMEQVTLTGLVGTTAYTIQDPSGREVLRGRFSGIPSVDVRGLVPGVYTMRIDDAVSRTVRFVKH
ncbi:MAG: T9SS type A sorting domain-containing protein, partial [Flavobacteriales bacterium]|nr:T9SS type A sorting domain-containing protein [Flavobacteriales bacterium]